jgi:hypothetical chaperone protein
MQRFGLDFGTTNSSLAWARDDGDVVFCDVDLRAPSPRVLRSLLYFSLEERGFVVGQRAIDEYLAENMQGTLIQSIKTFLAAESFEQTWINDRFYRLEDLIAVIFRHVHAAIRGLAGDDEVALVMGRPAIYVDRPEREALAHRRLRRAAQLAGFFDLQFQFEPVAAGLAYEASLRQPELAFIADLGGGTSDFTVMRLGGGTRGDRRADILASGGVQVAGDSFNARIMTQRLAKYFGDGTTFRSMEGREMPFPKQLVYQLGRWHEVSFLRGPRTRDQLRRIQWTSSAPARLAALEEFVDGNYAFFLFQEIERAKSRLSEAETTTIRFHKHDIHIEEPLTRREFEELIAPEQAEIERCMRTVLRRSGASPGDVGAVFLTGGSAQIPAIRRMFAAEFGEEKLRAQDYITSVAYGLGVVARDMEVRAPGARREDETHG